MRRITLFAIILLMMFIFGIFTIPYLDGYFFRINFLNMIASLNQTAEINHYPVKIEVTNYQLGWLHSDAKLNFVFLDKDLNRNHTQEFNSDYHISHGPLVYDHIQKKYTPALAVVTSKTYLPSLLQILFLGN